MDKPIVIAGLLLFTVTTVGLAQTYEPRHDTNQDGVIDEVDLLDSIDRRLQVAPTPFPGLGLFEFSQAWQEEGTLPRILSAPQGVPYYPEAEGNYDGVAYFFINDGTGVFEIRFDLAYPLEPAPGVLLNMTPVVLNTALSTAFTNRNAFLFDQTAATATLSIRFSSGEFGQYLTPGISGPVLGIPFHAEVTEASKSIKGGLGQTSTAELVISNLSIRDDLGNELESERLNGFIRLLPTIEPTPTPGPSTTVSLPSGYPVVADRQTIQGSIPVTVTDGGGIQALRLRVTYSDTISDPAVDSFGLNGEVVPGDIDPDVYLEHNTSSFSADEPWYEVFMTTADPLPAGTSGTLFEIPFFLIDGYLASAPFDVYLQIDSEVSYVQGAFDNSRPPVLFQPTFENGFVTFSPPAPTPTPTPPPDDPVGLRLVQCAEPLYSGGPQRFIIDGIDEDGNINNQGAYDFSIRVDNGAILNGGGNTLSGSVAAGGFLFDLEMPAPGQTTLTFTSSDLPAPPPVDLLFEQGATISGDLFYIPANLTPVPIPADSVRIGISPAGETPFGPLQFNDTAGEFRIGGIAPGAYDLVVAPFRDYQGEWPEIGVETGVKANPDAMVNFELDLSAAATLRGTVTTNDGTTPTFAEVNLLAVIEGLDETAGLSLFTAFVTATEYETEIPAGSYETSAIGLVQGTQGTEQYGSLEPVTVEAPAGGEVVQNLVIIDFVNLIPLSPVNGELLPDPSSESVVLTWSRPDEFGDDLWRYRVEVRCRCSDRRFVEEIVSGNNTVSLEITSNDFQFNPDDTYEWIVTAVNDNDEGAINVRAGIPPNPLLVGEFGFEHGGSGN